MHGKSQQPIHIPCALLVNESAIATDDETPDSDGVNPGDLPKLSAAYPLHGYLHPRR